MKLLRNVVVVLAAALGLVVQAAPPASAEVIGGAVLVLEITTSVGLCYPGLCDPPEGATFAVTDTVACAGQADYAAKGKGPGGLFDAEVFLDCNVAAGGTFADSGGDTPPLFLDPLGPYCGRSSGALNAGATLTYTNASSVVRTVGFGGAGSTFQTAGSAVAFVSPATGLGQSGVVVFVGDALPNPSTIGVTTCASATPTQTEFLVTGIANMVLT